MSNLENSKRAAKGTSRTDNASRNRKQSDKPQADGPEVMQLIGIITYDMRTNSFLFEPSDCVDDRVTAFTRHGVAQRLTSGAVVFNPDGPRKRYVGLRITGMPHGRVNLTESNKLNVVISVPLNEGGDVADTILRDSQMAVRAVRKFLSHMTRLTGKPVCQLTRDEIISRAAIESLYGDEKTPSGTESRNLEEANRLFEDAIEDHLAFGDAAPEVESLRCEEASSKRDCPTDESGQNHCGVNDVGDNNTTTDHIIYFGIQAQAEGYVAERTTTRRVKDPNGSGTDEAPYSEDLTQGGEVLPTVRRERSDKDRTLNKKNCDKTNNPKRNSAGRWKHSDSQGFVGGNPTC